MSFDLLTMRAGDHNYATSGGAAQTHHDTPATPQPEKTTLRDGASIAPSTSLTTAPTGGSSGGQKKPARRHDGTKPPGKLFERISEISDEEVCPSCQCLLTRSEINQNKVGRARRGQCNDCFRRMPAAVANMGGPSYSSRVKNATTESTTPPATAGAGPSFPPCQHRSLPHAVPCPDCERIERHQYLRRTNPFIPGKKTSACEHRGLGQFLPAANATPWNTSAMSYAEIVAKTRS